MDPINAAHTPAAWRALRHATLLIIGATSLLPLAFMVTTALSPAEATMRAGASLGDMVVPSHLEWDNFTAVWQLVPFHRFYFNSLFVALLVTAGKVLTSAMAAYAFARLRWPGRDTVFLAYLATLMVPGAVTMLPNFVLMKLLPGWLGAVVPPVDWLGFRYLGTGGDAVGVGRLVGLDSYFALIAPGVFTAYGTFMLRQYFIGLPRELDEAALLDGAGHWRIFTRLILPLSRPALITIALLSFNTAWTSFLWPLVVTNHGYMRTLPVGLQLFHGQYGTEWHLMMAAALLMLMPTVLLFLVGQRFFVAGLATGGVKG